MGCAKFMVGGENGVNEAGKVLGLYLDLILLNSCKLRMIVMATDSSSCSHCTFFVWLSLSADSCGTAKV